eukprot:s3024_g4.t1
MVVLLHIGIASCMEGGFAICLVACGTWLATLPEAKARHMPPSMDQGTAQLKRFSLGDATVLCWCLGTMAFAVSGLPSQPGPLPTVLLLNRWQVMGAQWGFSGAERHLHWEVAPARLADDAVVDLWSWRNVSFATPSYGRRGRWMSFPSTRPATERALEARFRYLLLPGSSVVVLRLDRKHLPAMEHEMSAADPDVAGSPDAVGTPDAGASLKGSNSRNKLSSKNVRVSVNANFIQQSTKNALGKVSLLKQFMNGLYFANFMVVVVLIDAFCTSAEIDARASGSMPSTALSIFSDACLILYTVEAVVLFWITEGMSRFSWMMLLDWLIIIAGWVELLLELILSERLGFQLAMMRSLRLVRIFRILHSLKRNRSLKELHKLAMMMATCFRTLLWSFLLCFIVMTVWAMLMVEMIYPSVTQMVATNGALSGCHQCGRAMSSVMDANLLLFRTVIAGDSWGEIAVPVIQEHPETAIVFVGSLLSLVFGVLNLIVAVVVDTFAEARQSDVQSLAEEMEDEVEHNRQILSAIFQRIDKDGSGELTLPELVKGAREDLAFHSRLRILDIDEDDLRQLFHMIDHDNSGTVEVEEFIGPLSRWAHDSKTAPRFIKYNMLQTMHLQQDLYDLSVANFNQLTQRMDDLAEQTRRLTQAPGPCVPSELPDTQWPEAPSVAGDVRESDAHDAGGEALERAKITYTELGLERVLHNLEMKLDLLMERGHRDASRRTSKSYETGGESMGLTSRGTDRADRADGPWRQPVKRPMRPMLHKEAFRNMYMRPRDPPSPPSPRWSGGDSSSRKPGASLASSLGLLFFERSGPRSLATSTPTAPLQSLEASRSARSARVADL